MWKIYNHYRKDTGPTIDPPAPAKEKEDNLIHLYSNDKLIDRAEKIVKALGYGGAIGEFTMTVYRVLEIYERLDREQAEKIAKAAEVPKYEG